MIDLQSYYPESLLTDVLTNRALTLVSGRDGRDKDPVLVASLSELAGVARDLSLPSVSKFETLVRVAASGHCRDLERAALSVLTGEG